MTGGASQTGSALPALLNRHTLRRMAGARSFERGEDYAASGRVGSLVEHAGTLTAKVQGTRPYRVKLWAEDGEIAYSCTCPVGQDGAFCKHCVAVALASVDRGRPKPASPTKPAERSVTMDDVRRYLDGQDKQALIGILMDHAVDDDRLRRRLLLKAAKTRSKDLDLGTYRRAIDEAVDSGGFVDYHAAYDYASGIAEAIDTIDELLQEGHPSEVVELTEHALHAVEEAVGFVDDSDGYMGEILERLQVLHLEACTNAKPKPEELARRLFTWELRTEWDTFYGAAETYARVLGKEGLAVYRQLAEAEWATVPSLRPGNDDAGTYGIRFRITHIMETLARLADDVDALVAVKQRDLSSAYDYLEIAETYQAARKHDLALEWAERGVKAFPDRTDSRLREFLANEYHRRKRHDEAMAIAWAAFVEDPALERYRALKRHADKSNRWKAWRPRALDALRESIARAKRAARSDRWAWSQRADHTELVRVFLWEKDVESAWREAQEGGCSNDLWMDLAAKRERDYPEDALPVYQRQIEPTLNRKNREAYREAVGLLRKMQGLMARLGRKAEFAQYLESVRATHKPKRNFMKLLERAKWS